MTEKIGRNDLCTCDSGKKYKQCCMLKQQRPGTPRKFTAKLISKSAPVPGESTPTAPDLIARTFAPVLDKAQEETPSANE